MYGAKSIAHTMKERADAERSVYRAFPVPLETQPLTRSRFAEWSTIAPGKKAKHKQEYQT